MKSFSCVILAAGEGSRAGGYKPLWRIGDGAIIDRVIAAAATVSSEIRVVGGHRFDELRAHIVEAWPGVRLVFNRSWTQGMFSSVRVGLRGIEQPAFIHPADIPGPGAEVYQALAERFLVQQADVTRPVFRGSAGHPVLLSRKAVNAVGNAPSDSSLRDVLRSLPKIDVEVATDLILRDIDTPEDFEILRERMTHDHRHS